MPMAASPTDWGRATADWIEAVWPLKQTLVFPYPGSSASTFVICLISL